MLFFSLSFLQCITSFINVCKVFAKILFSDLTSIFFMMLILDGRSLCEKKKKINSFYKVKVYLWISIKYYVFFKVIPLSKLLITIDTCGKSRLGSKLQYITSNVHEIKLGQFKSTEQTITFSMIELKIGSFGEY